MRKRTTFLVSLAALIIAVVIILAAGGFFLLIRGMTEAMGPSKPAPMGTIGAEMDSRTKEWFKFATQTSGLAFPMGTMVDIYDSGNYVVACLTLPTNTVETFLKSNHIQLQKQDNPAWVRGLQDLRPENQTIPVDIMVAEPLPESHWKPGIQFFVHQATRKCWLVIHCEDWNGK